MQIDEITLHNYRSIQESTFHLGSYSLLIGANNSGKSNIFDAIRTFYERDLKYIENRDFPKFRSADNDSWIEITYKLNEDEYRNLKDEWKQPDNKLKVRKYLKDSSSTKAGIYAYDISGGISSELFYGAKNVQQGKLGDLIYIPAAADLDSHTKLTGPSVLRELLNDILKKLIKRSTSFKNLTEKFDEFSDEIKSEKTDDNKSLKGLEEDISREIESWGAAFELQINPVTEADIVKNLVSYKIFNNVLEERMDAVQFGQGFQRHLIFTLIRTGAKYQGEAEPSHKKEFKPDMTLLLFEEPEAYLHPIKQTMLANSLKTLAGSELNQILLSSHSQNFVSHNSEDIASIIRLGMQHDRTNTGQIHTSKIQNIFSNNLEINELLKETKYAAHSDDFKEEMEAVKYFLWLNTERCGLFFSQLVLLVEGPSERVLIDYLINTGQISVPKGGAFVLDCLGKFNIHRFMNILGPMKIHHSVLFDADGGDPPHPEILKMITASANDYTLTIDTFPKTLEDFLEVDKCAPHRKPQHIMLKLKCEKIKQENVDAFIEKIQALVDL